MQLNLYQYPACFKLKQMFISDPQGHLYDCFLIGLTLYIIYNNYRMLACMQSLWAQPGKVNNHKQAFGVFEMEEQNATVHGLILDVSPVKQSRNNLDVEYYIGKDFRQQESSYNDLETILFYFRQMKLPLLDRQSCFSLLFGLCSLFRSVPISLHPQLSSSSDIHVDLDIKIFTKYVLCKHYPNKCRARSGSSQY